MKHRKGSAGERPLKIGIHLRLCRRERGLTLVEVSKLTEVSISSLSKIENEQVSPSFDIIKKICDGMGIGLEDLVRGGEVRPVLGRKTVTRQGEAVGFTSRPYDYLAHATELSQKGMVPLEIKVRARSLDDFDHWSQHHGEEFVYVLSGTIAVHTEHYSSFLLEAGESTYFDCGMAHVFISVSEEDAHILSISHDPQRLSRHPERHANVELPLFPTLSGSPVAANLADGQ